MVQLWVDHIKKSFIFQEKIDDEFTYIILERINGEHQNIASEVKLAVVYFYRVPPGLSPYFTLVDLPQAIN